MPAVIDNEENSSRPKMDEALEEDFDRKREEMHQVAKDRVLVVDNIPKIGPEKFQKLLSKLIQVFDKVGRLARDPNSDTPLLSLIRGDDGKGSTLGYAFAEFVTPEEAIKAMKSLHNLQFDRSHRFWACTAGDLERLQDVSEEFLPPPAPPVTMLDRPNFRSWLLDERGRDQFLIRHQDTTSVYWHDHVLKPQLVSLFISFLYGFWR